MPTSYTSIAGDALRYEKYLGDYKLGKKDSCNLRKIIFHDMLMEQYLNNVKLFGILEECMRQCFHA